MLRLRVGILFARCSIYHKPTWNMLPGGSAKTSGDQRFITRRMYGRRLPFAASGWALIDMGSMCR
jgi:hypothetical protein